MSERVTAEQCASLRRLDRLATKGPWVASAHLERIITVETGEESLFDRSDVAQLIMDKASDRLRVESDAALIVAMRNNLIQLLDTLATAEAALQRCLNYIENTESDLGIKLDCGDAARAALGEQP